MQRRMASTVDLEGREVYERYSGGRNDKLDGYHEKRRKTKHTHLIINSRRVNRPSLGEIESGSSACCGTKVSETNEMEAEVDACAAKNWDIGESVYGVEDVGDEELD